MTNIVVAGCATDRDLPNWKRVTSEVQATDPVPSCLWPDIRKDAAGQYVLAPDDVRLIIACQASEQGNHDIAKANAESVTALLATLDRLNHAGENYAALAQFRTDELEADRREAKIEAWTSKALTAVVLIAVALL